MHSTGGHDPGGSVLRAHSSSSSSSPYNSQSGVTGFQKNPPSPRQHQTALALSSSASHWAKTQTNGREMLSDFRKPNCKRWSR